MAYTRPPQDLISDFANKAGKFYDPTKRTKWFAEYCLAVYGTEVAGQFTSNPLNVWIGPLATRQEILSEDFSGHFDALTTGAFAGGGLTCLVATEPAFAVAGDGTIVVTPVGGAVNRMLFERLLTGGATEDSCIAALLGSVLSGFPVPTRKLTRTEFQQRGAAFTLETSLAGVVAGSVTVGLAGDLAATGSVTAAGALISDSWSSNGAGFVSVFEPLDLGGSVIQNVGDPINPQDAATKAYVDAATFGGPFVELRPALTGTGQTGFAELDGAFVAVVGPLQAGLSSQGLSIIDNAGSFSQLDILSWGMNTAGGDVVAMTPNGVHFSEASGSFGFFDAGAVSLFTAATSASAALSATSWLALSDGVTDFSSVAPGLSRVRRTGPDAREIRMDLRTAAFRPEIKINGTGLGTTTMTSSAFSSTDPDGSSNLASNGLFVSNFPGARTAVLDTFGPDWLLLTEGTGETVRLSPIASSGLSFDDGAGRTARIYQRTPPSAYRFESVDGSDSLLAMANQVKTVAAGGSTSTLVGGALTMFDGVLATNIFSPTGFSLSTAPGLTVTLATGAAGLQLIDSTGNALDTLVRPGQIAMQDATLGKTIVLDAATNSVTMNGLRVLREQLGAVANATGAGDIVARFNELLDRVRWSTGHGLISG